MDNYLKEIGKAGEELATKHYLDLWYTLLKRNYTIRWGEIDIIFGKWDILLFVEVKVINNTEEIDGYVSKKKIATLLKTIDYYLLGYPPETEISLDVVFVKGNRILEIYENVTNS
jgi:Holliday junction resolvase-like predicted endonuclease